MTTEVAYICDTDTGCSSSNTYACPSRTYPAGVANHITAFKQGNRGGRVCIGKPLVWITRSPV
jgi:hypothetical protein